MTSRSAVRVRGVPCQYCEFVLKCSVLRIRIKVKGKTCAKNIDHQVYLCYDTHKIDLVVNILWGAFMKREEKNQMTRRRILDSALSEFSAKGYGASSINTICAAQDLSKGIVYHYFETKDALFLACVEECFQRLTDYLRGKMQDRDGREGDMEDYFAFRTGFFHAHPVYRRIFCEAVIAPPAHLREEIRERKRDFDQLNMQILERLLAPFALRPGISREEVIDIFRQFQDFINVRWQTEDAGAGAFESREAACRRSLQILLYGVTERRESEHG
jgi:AcrR family transcriptional regulator